MKSIPKLIGIGLLALSVSPVLAGVLSAECPQVVTQALTATHQLCDNTSRNQACYGHVSIQAQPQPGIQNLSFNHAGDRVDVTDVQSLQLSQMETDTGNWGVALLRLQANLSTSDNKDITLLTFGDVKIENQVQVPTRMNVKISGTDYVNIRLAPNVSSGAMGVAAPGQTITALERLADNSWLRVEIPDSGNTGWVNATLVSSEGDINTLNAVASPTPYYRPMQSFYFESGQSDASCSDVPANGLLIQSPEGVGEVKLLINEVTIHLGSTVFFEAQPGKFLTVTTLEGHARVEAMGVEYTAVAGTQVQVPLDENGHPSAPPTMPQSSDASVLQALPIENLERPITIVPPLNQQDIEQVQQNQTNAGTNDTTTTTGGDSNNNCPGNSCHNQGNGQTKNCPGNSCHGQTNNGDNNGNDNGDDNGNGNGGGNGNGNGHVNGNGNGGGNGNGHGHG